MKKNKSLLYLFLFISILFLVSLIYNYFISPKIEPDNIIISKKGTTVAPFPPSFVHPLGTDRAGNDIALRLLGGFSYTFIFIFGVTVFRILIGGLFSYLLVFPLKRIKKWIQLFFMPFQFVPAFIICLLLMAGMVNFASIELNKWILLSIQFVIIVLIGIPVVMNTLTYEINHILKNEYIMASYTLGSNNIRIIFKHIIPVLKPKLIVLSLQQLSISLILLMHLGVFQFYIGGRQSNSLDDDGKRFLSQSGEWAGMIGESRYEIRMAPWIFFGSLTVAVIFLIIIHLAVKKYEHENSRA